MYKPILLLGVNCLCIGQLWADEEQLDTMVIQGQAETLEEERQASLSSTSALTGEAISDLGLSDIRDTLRMQGNTYIAPSNMGNNGISIRGINSEGVAEPGANSRPLINLVIDGAPQSIEGTRRGQRGTWDLESFTVSRGPQSNLQGRNTMAGSVVVKTKDPTPYNEMAARIIAGDQDLLSTAVMASGPINDEWSVRFAAEVSEAEKDIEHTNPKTAFLAQDEYQNLRFKTWYQPQSWSQFDVKFTLSHTVDDPAVVAVSGPAAGYDWRDRIFDASETAAESRRNEVLNSVIDARYQLNEHSEIISTTAYVQTKAKLTGAGGQGAALGYARDELREDNDISQTWRYLYEPVAANLSGELGFFVGRFENTRDSLVTLGSNSLQDIEGERVDYNAALFGELWWRFSPSWRLVTGLRLEFETSEQTDDERSDGVRYDSEFDNKVALPKIGLIKDLAGDNTLALTLSTGYRGGFREVDLKSLGNDENDPFANCCRDVKPEYLTNLELAYRSSWWEDKLKFNASLFYNQWRDQQVTIPKSEENTLSGNGEENQESNSATVLDTTINAEKATSYGVELDLALRLFTATDLGLSLGLLKTKFDSFDDSQYQGVVGNEFPEAPRASGGVWITSRFGNHWFVSGDLSARSSAFATSDIRNQEDKRIPGHAVAGLRLGYEAALYSVVGYIDNLFDRDYLVGRDKLNSYYVGDARSIGVTLTLRY